MSQQAFPDALSGDGGMADAPPPLPAASFFGDALAEDFATVAPQLSVTSETAATAQRESQGAGQSATRGNVSPARASSTSSAPDHGSRANASSAPAEIVPVATRPAAPPPAPARPFAPVPQPAAHPVPGVPYPPPFAPVAGAQPPFSPGYPGQHQQQLQYSPFFGGNAAPQLAPQAARPVPARPVPARAVPARATQRQAPRTGARGQSSLRPAGQKQGASSAGCFTYLVIAIMVLIFTGVGGKILDAIGEVLDW